MEPIKVKKKELDPFIIFVREINKEIIKNFGGATGRVNEGNLAYVLYNSLRKAKKYRGDTFYTTWASKALEGISQTHPFTDGNKRTAYLICKLILMLGEMDFEVPYEKATSYIIKIAKRRVQNSEIKNWVIKHAKKPEKYKKQSKDLERFITLLRDIIE